MLPIHQLLLALTCLLSVSLGMVRSDTVPLYKDFHSEMTLSDVRQILESKNYTYGIYKVNWMGSGSSRKLTHETISQNENLTKFFDAWENYGYPPNAGETDAFFTEKGRTVQLVFNSQKDILWKVFVYFDTDAGVMGKDLVDRYTSLYPKAEWIVTKDKSWRIMMRKFEESLFKTALNGVMLVPFSKGVSSTMMVDGLSVTVQEEYLAAGQFLALRGI